MPQQLSLCLTTELNDSPTARSCEFIPQMVFLNALFGYLCLLIVGKWVSGSTADLYHVMIYMFLSPGTGGLACWDAATGTYGCAENIMFPGQGPLQVRTPVDLGMPWCYVRPVGTCRPAGPAQVCNVSLRFHVKFCVRC